MNLTVEQMLERIKPKHQPEHIGKIVDRVLKAMVLRNVEDE